MKLFKTKKNQPHDEKKLLKNVQNDILEIHSISVKFWDKLYKKKTKQIATRMRMVPEF